MLDDKTLVTYYNILIIMPIIISLLVLALIAIITLAGFCRDLVDSYKDLTRKNFWNAIRDNNIDEVKKLFKYCDDIQKALMDTIYNGEVDGEIVRFLIDAGADINKADEKGKTAVMAAVLMGNVEVVKQLLKTPNLDLTVALYLARRSRHEEIIELLDQYNDR